MFFSHCFLGQCKACMLGNQEAKLMRSIQQHICCAIACCYCICSALPPGARTHATVRMRVCPAFRMMSDCMCRQQTFCLELMHFLMTICMSPCSASWPLAGWVLPHHSSPTRQVPDTRTSWACEALPTTMHNPNKRIASSWGVGEMPCMGKFARPLCDMLSRSQ